MPLTNKELSHLEAYSENILSTDEASTLKNKLTTDTDFGIEAIPFLQTIALLKRGRKQHVLSYLRAVENDLPTILVAKPVQRTWLRFAAAAAVVATLAMTWLLLAPKNLTREQTADNIVAEYLEPYTTIGILKDGAVPTAREQAMTAYANAEYKKTIQYLDNIPSAGRTPLDVFYLGYAHLAIQNYAVAQPLFESVLDNTEAPLAATSYYLALCHVAQFDNKGAQDILQNIQDDNSKFSAKAKALLEKLKSLQ
jgi:hypothetical protein